ncbi:MAG TPA: hypothetical protein VEK56_06010 [Vicinamibacterales bacterium]|nr:hypothetical protein [Vicinamibacterales bacterium]
MKRLILALLLVVIVLLLPTPATAQLRDLCDSSSGVPTGGWILDVT